MRRKIEKPRTISPNGLYLKRKQSEFKQSGEKRKDYQRGCQRGLSEDK